MDEKEEKVEQLFNTFTISTQLLSCLGRVKKVKAVKEYLVYYSHSRKEMSWEIFFWKNDIFAWSCSVCWKEGPLLLFWPFQNELGSFVLHAFLNFQRLELKIGFICQFYGVNVSSNFYGLFSSLCFLNDLPGTISSKMR